MLYGFVVVAVGVGVGGSGGGVCMFVCVCRRGGIYPEVPHTNARRVRA